MGGGGVQKNDKVFVSSFMDNPKDYFPSKYKD